MKTTTRFLLCMGMAALYAGNNLAGNEMKDFQYAAAGMGMGLSCMAFLIAHINPDMPAEDYKICCTLGCLCAGCCVTMVTPVIISDCCNRPTTMKKD